MALGININIKNIKNIKNLNFIEFIEIADFVFPQTLLDTEFMKEVDDILKKNSNIKCLEGPIRDIKPEAGDIEIREITKKRFIQLIELASKNNIKYVMFSSTFDPLVKFDFYTDMWLINNKKFWEEIIKFAEDKKIVCLYCNVRDDTPELLYELFRHINSEYFRFAMDIGHLNYMSKHTIKYWFEKMEPFLEYICIHDNHGERDDHLPLGEGVIDFKKIAKYIKKLNRDIDICIQLFDQSNIQKSIDKWIQISNNV